MNTATLSHGSASTGLRAYFTDVGHAALAFAAALFAAQERKYIAQPVSAPRAAKRSLFRDRTSLLAMAADYQHMHPNLAGELRNLAGRD
jgi:hypothetical protein